MLREGSKQQPLPFSEFGENANKTLKLKYKTLRGGGNQTNKVGWTHTNSVCCKIHDDHTVFIIWQVLFELCSWLCFLSKLNLGQRLLWGENGHRVTKTEIEEFKDTLSGSHYFSFLKEYFK